MTWLSLCLVLLVSPRLAGAPETGGLPVPGGTARLLRAAGIRVPVERDRALLVLIRGLYQTRSTSPEAGPVIVVRRHLDAVAKEKSGGDSVPALLPPAVWEQAVFGKKVATQNLVTRILTNREAALLYYGLFSLDDETLVYFIEHPSLISTIYKRAGGAFAAFGDSIAVHDGRVRLPGPPSSAEGWESVVGAPAAAPEAFIAKLLTKDQGRLAWLFDTVSRLGDAQQTFVLGNGREGVRSLYSAFGGFDEGWTVQDTPFTRFAFFDATMVLQRVAVTPDGAMALPGGRVFWQAVFSGHRLAFTGVTAESGAGADRVTAPWLIDLFKAVDPGKRGPRLDALLFAQRLIAVSTRARVPIDSSCLVETLTAFPDHEALIVTLEGIGFDDACDYALAVRAAAALTGGSDASQQSLRLAMFQGALALVARMRAVGTLTDATAHDLCLKLFPLASTDATQFPGALARWIETTLLPALPRTAPEGLSSAEGRLIDALAGPATLRLATAIEWEGTRYRLDFAAAERVRLRKILRRMGGPDVDGALELAGLISGITAPSTARADAQAHAATLVGLAPVLIGPGRTALFGYPIVGARDALLTAARQLSEGRADTQSAETRRSLAGGLAIVLAEVLASRVYATAIGNPDASILLGENPALGHDFALRPDQPQGPWVVADIPPSGTGSPAAGSLLVLARTLARYWLRPTTLRSPSVAPLLWQNEIQGFAETVAGFDPLALSDQSRDALVTALRRGRDRIAAAAGRSAELDRLAVEAGMEGWRRRLIRLAATGDPAAAPGYFSLGEMVALGLAGSATPNLDAWGPSMRPIDGSLECRLLLRLDSHEVTGYQRLNLLATRVADLQIRVAELLADLKLPAALAPGVMARATWDLAMNSQMADREDWLAVVRAARRLSADRVADYVSALTADGPLVPAAK